MGKPIYFKAAPEPSNIMWENQYWPKTTKLIRKLITFLVVCLILSIQFSVMFFINKKVVQVQNRYPIVDCTDVKKIYGDTLEKFAIIQWNDYTHGLNVD
jgi:hypothetical protein